MRLKESMDIIARWDANQELLFPEFNQYINDIDLEEKPIDIWRERRLRLVSLIVGSVIIVILYMNLNFERRRLNTIQRSNIFFCRLIMLSILKVHLLKTKIDGLSSNRTSLSSQ